MHPIAAAAVLLASQALAADDPFTLHPRPAEPPLEGPIDWSPLFADAPPLTDAYGALEQIITDASLPSPFIE